ncbi:hypothetical protein ACLBXM_19755 [Xanthobacteraceae bacterium A53D]
MTWTAIDFAAVRELGIFDYETGFALSVHPDIVWNDKPNAAGPAPRILLHEGDLSLEGLTFVTNRFASPEADMLIVRGNLTLAGDLFVDQFDVGTPGYLLVTGNLQAQNLFLTQQFELLVRGGVSVSGVIYGHEGSSGLIRCAGTVRAPLTVLETYPLRAARLEGTALVQMRWDETAPTEAQITDTASGRIVGVRADELLGTHWLLEVPAGLEPDDIPDEAIPGYSVLTPEALAAYEGNGGPLRITELLRTQGANAIRPNLLKP